MKKYIILAASLLYFLHAEAQIQPLTVQVEGKIKVKNFKDKQLDLRLQRTITGSLQKTNTPWLKEEIVNPNNPRNRMTNVCWETPIKANSELEIVYTYEVYLPAY